MGRVGWSWNFIVEVSVSVTVWHGLLEFRDNGSGRKEFFCFLFFFLVFCFLLFRVSVCKSGRELGVYEWDYEKKQPAS